MSQDPTVRFVRINGRVVPIKVKPGEIPPGKGMNQGAKSGQGKMPGSSQRQKGPSVAARATTGLIGGASFGSVIGMFAGTGLGVAGAVLGNRGKILGKIGGALKGAKSAANVGFKTVSKVASKTASRPGAQSAIRNISQAANKTSSALSRAATSSIGQTARRGINQASSKASSAISKATSSSTAKSMRSFTNKAGKNAKILGRKTVNRLENIDSLGAIQKGTIGGAAIGGTLGAVTNVAANQKRQGEYDNARLKPLKKKK
jgi:histone H3/H4